jgi:hypothetical protein
MTTYDFTLILSSPAELTDEFADKLFAAGCDDGTPSSADGILSVDPPLQTLPQRGALWIAWKLMRTHQS